MPVRVNGKRLRTMQEYDHGVYRERRPDIVPHKQEPKQSNNGLIIRYLLLIVTAIMSAGHSIPVVMSNYNSEFLPQEIQTTFLYVMGVCAFLSFELGLVIYQSQDNQDITTKRVMVVFFIVLLLANIGGGLLAAKDLFGIVIAVAYGIAVPGSALALGSSFHNLQVERNQELKYIEDSYEQQQRVYRESLEKSYKAYLKRQGIVDENMQLALISNEIEEFIDYDGEQNHAPQKQETKQEAKTEESVLDNVQMQQRKEKENARSLQGVSMSQQIRDYVTSNPNLTNAEVAKELGTSASLVSQVRGRMN